MIKSFFLLFLFLCVHFGKTTAQESKPTEYLNSPYSTMKTFLQSMKKVKKGDKDEMTRVLETLDLSHFSGPSRVESGILAAQRLINTIDRLEYVNLEDIPKKNDGPDWIFRKQTVFLADGAHQVEITISKSTDGNWRFSPETVDSIKYFYLAFKDRPIVKGAYEYITWKTRFKNLMPQWMGSRIFIFQNGQWIALFLLIFLGLLFERVMRFVLNRYVLSLFKKKGLSIDQNFSQKFILPFGVITVSGVWILGLPLLELDDRVLSLFLRIGQVFFAIGSVWFAYLLVDLIASYFEKLATKSENKFDDILVPLLRKSAKIFVVCVGMVFIGHSLTLNVTNILAGLGIGGLAFALAAKDMLSNLFGSLSVILDRPFHIGDWVLINDNIEGTVTEVGFRSTRLRTFYDSLITVPNNILTNAKIDNFGRRTYRRFTTKIGIQYNTSPEKIEALCEGIRQLILAHQWTRKDYFHVYLNGLGSSSLDILLYVFWKVPDWSDELNEKHRLLVDILRLGHELGIEFAFPTTTVHLFNEEKTPETSLDQTPLECGKSKAQQIGNQSITPLSSRSGLKSFS